MVVVVVLLFSGTTQVSWYQKGSGSGIIWAICKSAPSSRQTTTPAPHHSVFYRPFLPPNQPSFIGLFSRTIWVSRYQKGKTNLDFTGARDSAWQWHHLGHMQVCTQLQTDNHASTPPLSFLQALPAAQPTASKH